MRCCLTGALSAAYIEVLRTAPLAGLHFIRSYEVKELPT